MAKVSPKLRADSRRQILTNGRNGKASVASEEAQSASLQFMSGPVTLRGNLCDMLYIWHCAGEAVMKMHCASTRVAVAIERVKGSCGRPSYAQGQL